jgi:hypothetical protein
LIQHREALEKLGMRPLSPDDMSAGAARGLVPLRRRALSVVQG